MATLMDLIERLDSFDAEDVIFVKAHWHKHAEARLFRLTEDYSVPEEATRLGFKYFLEVDVARQVLEEFRNRPEATSEEKCERVIQYAFYDA